MMNPVTKGMMPSATREALVTETPSPDISLTASGLRNGNATQQAAR